jgi:hypothetical protein
MVRFFAVLGGCAIALALTGCEPPAASSLAAKGPPGPPAPPVPAVSIAADEVPTPVGFGAATGAGVDSPAGAETTFPTASLPGDGGLEAVDPGAAVPVAAPLPVDQSPPARSGVTAAERGNQSFVSLSAGVAVPQLLPDGTQIGVSVDYSLRGEPKTSCRYLLVVETTEGEIALPVTLDSRGGNFQGFLPPAVRPEHKPFRARIDELPPGGERSRVSNSAVLATSY